MKITTRATLTLNPLRLVIEQTECPSSSNLPAARPYVETDGEEVTRVRGPSVIKCESRGVTRSATGKR